jgi:hypothetical protein
MEIIEAQVIDAVHLKLSQSLTLPPGSKIFIAINPPEGLDTEQESWHKLSMLGLKMAYGDQEPDYTNISIKKTNPEFQP